MAPFSPITNLSCTTYLRTFCHTQTLIIGDMEVRTYGKNEADQVLSKFLKAIKA